MFCVVCITSGINLSEFNKSQNHWFITAIILCITTGATSVVGCIVLIELRWLQAAIFECRVFNDVLNKDVVPEETSTFQLVCARILQCKGRSRAACNIQVLDQESSASDCIPTLASCTFKLQHQHNPGLLSTQQKPLANLNQPQCKSKEYLPNPSLPKGMPWYLSLITRPLGYLDSQMYSHWIKLHSCWRNMASIPPVLITLGLYSSLSSSL